MFPHFHQRGSATIMAVDHVDGNSHFDCIRDAWDKITGQSPGILPMQFTQVPCDGVSGNPVIVNWADKNAYYCKMMFENVGGWGGVDGVHMCIDGGNCGDLTLFQGATWTGCPQGEGNSATFTLSQRGSKVTCNCQSSWPWDHGARCNCPSNFPSSSGCTGQDQDPWASGNHVPCCSGLNEVLKNWDGDDRWYYKCEGGSIAVPPPTPSPDTCWGHHAVGYTDCVGDDLSNVSANSLDDCCLACQTTSGCGTGVFVKGGQEGNTCHLKKGTCVEKEGCPGDECIMVTYFDPSSPALPMPSTIV